MPARSRFAVGWISSRRRSLTFRNISGNALSGLCGRILEPSQRIVEEDGMSQHFDSVDEYIAQFPSDVQDVLQEVRRSATRPWQIPAR